MQSRCDLVALYPPPVSRLFVGEAGFSRGSAGPPAFGSVVNWIRLAVGIGDDPKVHRLADRLERPVAGAVGHLVLLLTKFPEHAPDGNLAQVPASLVERWAAWDGERGAFDEAFRPLFLVDGVWLAWDKHNGLSLRKLERDRERLRQIRESRADAALTVAGLSRDGRNDVAGTDGRTDEVQLRGGRKRPNGNGHQPLAPYKPDPFCPDCGQGMGKLDPSDRKLVQLHTTTCPTLARPPRPGTGT
jgi:hypothetical protein